jgi:hypothetical protein
MEHNGEHKRDKSLMIYWIVIGIGLGIVIGASTKEWGLGLPAGIAMGIGMAFFATKSGVDQ